MPGAPRTVIACHAAYNDGGLGKVLAALVEQARAAGTLQCYFSRRPRPGDGSGRPLPLQGLRRLLRLPLLRSAPGWREWLGVDGFDRAVARRLPRADVVVAVAGQALHTFRRARQLGAGRLVLVAANSHIDNVARAHRRARAARPIEPGWLTAAQHRKTVREYAVADEIWTASEYSRDSFLAAGIAAERLHRFVIPIEPRFAPPLEWPRADGFRMLYVGRLEVTKGVPILLEAFAHMRDPAARLTLVGGYATPAMQRTLERAAAADARVALAGGDPLPHLHRADVFVHPSYEDGLGLAPLEALACGIPVVVTADTGMREYVVDGVNGFVVPTGDVGALLDRLAAVRATPLKGRFAPVCVEAPRAAG